MIKKLSVFTFLVVLVPTFVLAQIDSDYILPDEDDYSYAGDGSEAPTTKSIQELMQKASAPTPAVNEETPLESESALPDAAVGMSAPQRLEKSIEDPQVDLRTDRDVRSVGPRVTITETTRDGSNRFYQQKRFSRSQDQNDWLDVFHYDMKGELHELKQHDLISDGGKFVVIHEPQRGPQKHTNFNDDDREHVVYGIDGTELRIGLDGEMFVIADGDDQIMTDLPVVVDDATGVVSIVRGETTFALRTLPHTVRAQFAEAMPHATITDLEHFFVGETEEEIGQVYAVTTVEEKRLLGLTRVSLEKKFYVDVGSGLLVGEEYPFGTYLKDQLSF